MLSSRLHSGFTLLETLVATSILMIGVIGPLIVATRGITDGLYAQNQITASFLAEEAIETIINRRDSNILVGDPWDTGFKNNDTQLEIDPATGDILTGECVDSQGCFLNYNASAGYYVNSPTGPGAFQRRAEVSGITDGGVEIGKKITVTVWWKNKTLPQHFTMIGYIYAE